MNDGTTIKVRSDHESTFAYVYEGDEQIGLGLVFRKNYETWEECEEAAVKAAIEDALGRKDLGPIPGPKTLVLDDDWTVVETIDETKEEVPAA